MSMVRDLVNCIYSRYRYVVIQKVTDALFGPLTLTISERWMVTLQEAQSLRSKRVGLLRAWVEIRWHSAVSPCSNFRVVMLFGG